MTSWSGEPTSLRDAVLALARELGTPVALLAGSAVSRAGPSSLPMVFDFYKMLGSAPCLQLPSDIGERLYQRQNVAFELLMEELRNLLADGGRASVRQLLESVYSIGEPNSHHQTIVTMLESGEIDALLTTNFDLHLSEARSSLIRADDVEKIGITCKALRNGRALERSLSGTVIHLHASILSKEFDAYMSRVGEPVSDARRDLIELMLERGFSFVFVGYRGQDADLIPVVSPSVDWRTNPRIGHIAKPTDETPPDRTVAFDLDRSGEDCLPEAQRRIHDWVVGLDRADRTRLAALLLHRAGYLKQSRDRYRLALGLAPGTPATTIGLAVAYADQMLYRRAIAVLALNPNPNRAESVRWLAFRGLLKRQIGHELEAIRDFEQARAGIARFERDESVRALLIMAVCQEIEARAIVASASHGKKRRLEVVKCGSLLAEAERLAKRSPSIPRHDIEFYRAEIAMLCGEFGEAAAGYKRFREGVARWRPGSEGRVGDARRIAALAFAGRRRDAAQEFWARLHDALRNKWPIVALHVIAAGLIVACPSPDLYWWLRRRVGPLVYGLVEVIGLGWTWASGLAKLANRGSRIRWGD